jgi:nicotinamidase/pyrazinamidase
MNVSITSDSALIIVDVQVDFCPGGTLPVPDGDKIIPFINRYIKIFKENNLPIIATRDWHPPNHISFKPYGGIWPIHCVQNTPGAAFHPKLKLPNDVIIISKATEPNKEAYSGFEGTELSSILNSKGVRRLFIGGLATDYCVKNTVLDALKLGFQAFLLLDGTKGVNVNPDDSKKAIEEMVRKGAVAIRINNILK